MPEIEIYNKLALDAHLKRFQVLFSLFISSHSLEPQQVSQCLICGNQKGTSRMYKQDNVFRASARRDDQDNRAKGQIHHKANDGD